MYIQKQKKIMKKNNHNSTEREVRDTLSVAPDFVELEEVTTINGKTLKIFSHSGSIGAENSPVREVRTLRMNA
jgi:hypothetical protein